MQEIPLRDPKELVCFLESWLVQRVKDARAQGGVVGLSGGVDSAVVAALLRRCFGREGTLAVLLPCHSQPVDREHAELVAQALDLPTCTVDLSGAYDALLAELQALPEGVGDLARANLKPRLRMTALFALAQSRGFLVCGTGNRAELTTGYFTKYGDSGVDLLPLGDLLKHEVWALARYLGVPAEVVDKPPTAGLWPGQTDEGEMGLTYREIDGYLSEVPVSPEVRERIETAFRRSAHKRALPPIAQPPRSSAER